jgi:hypothetical protein
MKIKFKVCCSPQNTKKIECAQGFNVQKISEQEALIARQSIKMCPSCTFKGALNIAGLTYDESKNLRNNEAYDGYVAIFIRHSEILIAKLNGSMFLKNPGGASMFSKISVDGSLYWVDDIGAKLRKGLKDEKISRPLFDRAICALKGNSEFKVTEAEMRAISKVCCPECIEVTYKK